MIRETHIYIQKDKDDWLKKLVKKGDNQEKVTHKKR